MKTGTEKLARNDYLKIMTVNLRQYYIQIHNIYLEWDFMKFIFLIHNWKKRFPVYLIKSDACTVLLTACNKLTRICTQIQTVKRIQLIKKKDIVFLMY